MRKHQFLPPHSTIVKFHRSWEEQGRLYQQFELCNGTLQELAESEDNIPQVLLTQNVVKSFTWIVAMLMKLPFSVHSVGIPGRPASGAATPAWTQSHPHGHQAREHFHREGRDLQGWWLWLDAGSSCCRCQEASNGGRFKVNFVVNSCPNGSCITTVQPGTLHQRPCRADSPRHATFSAWGLQCWS